MKCLNQNCEANDIENDDNFCYKCGHWTSRGFDFLKNKNNIDMIANGDAIKQDTRFVMLLGISILGIIIFIVLLVLRGGDIFRPIYFIKRKIDNYTYGYNTAIIKTDNIYNKENISSLEDAKMFIEKDFDRQEYKCSSSIENFKLSTELENTFDITSVVFCDISYEESEKITNVIKKMYVLFPNIKGSLTNISITNALSKEKYIARFQPMFQFVNPNEDINRYNKVNKTQILLNSYYFLNEKIMSDSIESVVGKDWYVKDATWESTIAHEIGHYITFKAFLKQNNLDNIILITKDNEQYINNLLKEYDSGIFSKKLLNDAVYNYNETNNNELTINDFAKMISKYANEKNDKGEIIADETIAEAIHDYYLHGSSCSEASLEIVKLIKAKL